ncbi:Metallo-dependent hydrolase [Trametes polyzona]|nr:Metallo-dependent hydrolase [Trametes polyzona]
MSKYLLKGGTVVTFVKGEDKPRVYKADVLVEGTTISRIEQNIEPPQGAEVVNCENKWIAPGFVDTHRHTFMAISRGAHVDITLSEYVLKSFWTVQGSLTPEEVGIGTLAGCLEALSNGVTTILDHFNTAHTPAHADAALRSVLESGARVIWALARQSSATRVFPQPAFENEVATEKWQREKVKELGANGGNLRPDGRVTLGLAYDISWQGPIETHKEWLDYARANSVKLVTAHVSGNTTVAAWRDGGLLGQDVLFSHCNHLGHHTPADEEAWAALKESGAAVGATPVNEIGMSYGNHVAFDALERGVKVGLGADTSTVASGDMFMPMRMALQWARGRQIEHRRKSNVKTPLHQQYTTADVFRLATLGGAEALNLSHLVGSVEVGKRADLLVFDADSVNLAGAQNPVASIVMNAAAADIETVFVDGEVVKRGGKLVRDWKPVAAELRARAQDVSKRWPEDKLEETWKQWYETYGPPVL